MPSIYSCKVPPSYIVYVGSLLFSRMDLNDIRCPSNTLENISYFTPFRTHEWARIRKLPGLLMKNGEKNLPICLQRLVAKLLRVEFCMICQSQKTKVD